MSKWLWRWLWADGVGDGIGKLLAITLFIFILLLAFDGFWALFTNTNPEYFDWCASYGC